MSRRIYQSKESYRSVPTKILSALDALYGPLCDSRHVAQVSRGLEKLHRGLTRDRKRFIKSRYLKDRDVCLAYATYMVCAQAPKLDAIVERLGPLPKLDRPLRVLELGCGPGTGIASLGCLAETQGVEIEHIATDRVPEALDAARRLSNALKLDHVDYKLVDLSRGIARQLDDPPPFDLVLCMNVLNELNEDRLRLMSRELKGLLTKEGQILVIEPAAQVPSRHIIQFRDACVEQGWHIAAPCPHDEGCPMLQHDTDWCHDTWGFERPEFMELVDAQVGTRRETLKATWFLFKKTESQLTSPLTPARVISEQFKEKGRVHAKVCTATGLKTLELQKRDRTPENRAFSKIYRYDLIAFSKSRAIGQRERLGKDSRCEFLAEDGTLTNSISGQGNTEP